MIRVFFWLIIFFLRDSSSDAWSTTTEFYKWDELKGIFKTELESMMPSNFSSHNSNNNKTTNDKNSGKEVTNSKSSSDSGARANGALRGRPLASQLIGGMPVYISMTTIHNRLYGVADTLETILKGTVLPTHIYIFVSSEPYLLDQGISKDFLISSSHKLRALSENFPFISVIYTDNIGPHRKLLPLLAKKWEEDCVLVTVDDHEMYPKGMLASLIGYYRASGGTAVVALRSRRMGICANAPPWKVSPYTKKHKGLWPETKAGRREMLMLPTGTGGVLYRPRFFHPIVFDKRFLNLTRTGDDLMFRLATMAKGVPVVTACTEYDEHQRVCPTQSSDSVLSNQELPLDPQLKSIKRVEFEEGSASSENNTTHSQVVGANLRSVQTTVVASNKMTVNPTEQPDVKIQSSTAHKSVDKKTNTEEAEETDEEEARVVKEQSNARTLQQKAAIRAHEYRLAALNEVGSLRRKLSKVLMEELGGGGEMFDSVGTLSISQKHVKQNSLVSAGTSSAGGREEHEHQENDGKQRDMRKKESLASKFNSLGGNNVMWTHSITYLHHMGVLDFESVLQFYAPKERMPCVLLSSVFSKGAGAKNRGMFSGLLDSLRVSLQNIYNHECGVLLCTEEDES